MVNGRWRDRAPKLSPASALQTKKPHAPCDGEWGWKDGWFSETGLLAATADLSRRLVAPWPLASAEAVIYGDGG